MDQQKLCGIAIGLMGGWLLYGAYDVILAGLRAGAPLTEILTAAFSLRFLAAMSAFIAGVAALTEVRGGAWFAGIATFVMGVLAVGMILFGVDKAVWQAEIINLFILTSLFLGTLVARGQSFAKLDIERELAEIAAEEAAAAGVKE